MARAKILVNGAPVPDEGGIRNLSLAAPVALANDGDGDESTYEWSIIDQTGRGPGETAVLSSVDQSTTNLTMPRTGSVRVRLIVDRNTGTQDIHTVVLGFPNALTGQVTPAPTENDPSTPWLRDIGQDVWQKALGGYQRGVVCRALTAITPGTAVVAVAREVIHAGTPVEATIMAVQPATLAVRTARTGPYGPYGIMLGAVPGSPENLSLVVFDGPVRKLNVPSPVNGGLVVIADDASLVMDTGLGYPVIGVLADTDTDSTVYVGQFTGLTGLDAANVVTAALPDWLGGRTNPAGTVQSVLEKLVTDLGLAVVADDGAERIGAAARAGTPIALTAGSVASQMVELLAGVNGAERSTAAGNTWLGEQRIHGPADPLVERIETDAGAANHAVLWAMRGGNAIWRIISSPSSLMFTGNAYPLVSGDWQKDDASTVPIRILMDATRFVVSSYHGGTVPWTGLDWTGTSARSWTLDLFSMANDTHVVETGEREVSGAALTGMTAHESQFDNGTSNIGGASSFTSGRLPSSPGSVSLTVVSQGGSGGPTFGAPTPFVSQPEGVGWFSSSDGSAGYRFRFLTFSAI